MHFMHKTLCSCLVNLTVSDKWGEKNPNLFLIVLISINITVYLSKFKLYNCINRELLLLLLLLGGF